MYAVVVYSNFDLDCPVTLFEDENEAKAYLHCLWENSYNTEIAESFVPLNEHRCWHEEVRALITWQNGDFTEFILTEISKPNDKINWSFLYTLNRSGN